MSVRTTLLCLLLLVASCSSRHDAMVPPGGKAIIHLDPHGPMPPALDAEATGYVDLALDANTLAFTVNRRVDSWWKAAVRIDVDEPLHKGDVLMLTCQMRTDEMGTQNDRPSALFIFKQRGGDRMVALVSQSVGIPNEWRTVSLPFVATYTTAPGEAYLILGAGPMPQHAEIRNLRVLNFGTSRTVDELPRTRVTYDGRDGNAPWRGPAQEKIERYRMGDITVDVTGPDGAPVKGAFVKIRMQRHAFEFGTMVRAHKLRDWDEEDPDRARYLRAVFENFNAVTFGVLLKERAWEEGSREAALRWLAFFTGRGIRVHGHALVWAWEREQRDVIPQHAYAALDDPGALQAYILESIRDRMEATRDQIEHWDVVNEPVERCKYRDIQGADATVEWFEMAKRTDPNAGLMLNDFDILNGKNLDAYIQLHRYYMDRGVRFDAVGVQGHIPAPIDIPVVYERLGRLATLGAPIIITEYDMISNDDQLQADYMRDLLTLLFSHPSVGGFYQWGFWAQTHWRPQAAMYNRDWTERPNLRAYRQLVLDEWMTREDGITDAAGRYSARGFKGEYTVTVRHEGRSAKRTFELSDAPCQVRIALE